MQTSNAASGAGMRIRKVGVVGAGVMGSGIAALAASAGIPVVLLDVAGPEGQRGAPAAAGLDKARKARPAAFMDPEGASLVQTGNIDDDLARLGECDLIIEAIVELPAPKQALYARLEPLLKPTAIVASNTSGIPMRILTEGRSERFRRHFLGMHFFNPVRYMHLLELIPTGETAPEVLGAARRFSERVFGKGIVLAKDAPGFVANRLGVAGMVRTMTLMEEFGLSIDEVDFLTGPFLARAKSATFRTADISGLDVLSHVAAGLASTTGEDYTLPSWMQQLVQEGKLGEKTKAGFYRKEGKEIHTLDWRTMQYAPAKKVEDPELLRIGKLPHAARFAAIRELPGTYGDFLRAYLLTISHYALTVTPEVAFDVASVDRAMEWGYAWEIGPFKQMDLLGADFLRAGFAERGLAVPAMLDDASRGFYPDDATPTVLAIGGGYDAVTEIAGGITIASLARAGRTLQTWDEAALHDLGDGVALFEFRSKMNTLGEGVVRALHAALDRVEHDGLAGLVIGNDDPRTFSAGANLAPVVQVVQEGKWDVIDESIRGFQGTAMRIRHSPFPIVSAPFGLALGGACEYSMHAARIQAHAELYMGLVEAGVGLLPAGGGTKEILFRFAEDLAPYDEADPFEAVKRAFKLIAMATTSTSAHEARKLGFLRAADRISMNRDTLLVDAKARVVDLAPDWVALPDRTITALGRAGLGNLKAAAWSMKEAGQISAFEERLAGEIAYVLCGGDGPPRTVTEQDILDLEREGFKTLLGTPETQERIAYTLKTGKPLRN